MNFQTTTTRRAATAVAAIVLSVGTLSACNSTSSSDASVDATIGAADTTVDTALETASTAGDTTLPAADTTSAAGSGDTTSAADTADTTDTTDTTDAAAAGPGGGGVGGGFGGQCSASGVTLVSAPATAVVKPSGTTAIAAGATAAQAFLSGLTEAQRSAAVFTYEDLDAKRCSWSNFPTGIFSGRVGMRMGDLDQAQRTAAMAVVKNLMSAAGYTYVEGAIAGDQYLNETQGESQMGTDNYYIAFYGNPATDSAWTMQFGGHHLAIHISVGDGSVSVSPYFQGLQPISYEVNGALVETMKQDADDMFGIFESLDATQRTTAQLSGGYDDLVMGPGVDSGYPTQEGLKYTDLSAAQKQLVKATIADWVADAAPELSGPLVDLYTSQLDQTTVSWATSTDRTGPAYMRIDGPRVWIEWVNTTAGGGLHYHTLYRDKLVDYGTGTTK